MGLVTITGNVWDHSRDPIPEAQQPRLWFRPNRSRVGAGLQAGVETQATLTASTGAFTVELESFPDTTYTPVLDYLISGSTDPDVRARGYIEFPPIFPGTGGDISSLGAFVGVNGIIFGFGPPPAHLSAVVYMDITGPNIRIYGPTGGNA